MISMEQNFKQSSQRLAIAAYSVLEMSMGDDDSYPTSDAFARFETRKQFNKELEFRGRIPSSGTQYDRLTKEKQTMTD